MSNPWPLMVYVTFALGGLAIYFLMPRTDRSTRGAGAIFGVAALAAAMVLCASRFLGTEGGNVFFYLSAVVAVASAVKVITHEKPVYSALYFVLTVLAIAPLLIIQHAEFLAVALVIIYAGAILVTYVFVIMLAQQGGASIYDRRARQPFVAVFGGFFTMALIAGQMTVLPEEHVVQGTLASASAERATELGNTAMIGGVMMTDYLVAFEIAGVLLLVAMVGAIAMSRKRVPTEVVRASAKPPGQIGREVQPF